MDDNDAALCAALRSQNNSLRHHAADRVEAQAAEIKRLRSQGERLRSAARAYIRAEVYGEGLKANALQVLEQAALETPE